MSGLFFDGFGSACSFRNGPKYSGFETYWYNDIHNLYLMFTQKMKKPVIHTLVNMTLTVSMLLLNCHIQLLSIISAQAVEIEPTMVPGCLDSAEFWLLHLVTINGRQEQCYN